MSSMEAIMDAMDTPFLTISEAATKTGRSVSTIRRVIKTFSEDDTHPDRAAIQPTPKEVAAFRKKDENFAWKIREDVLLREFEGALKEAKKDVAEAKGDILSILQNELSLKNQQIEKQWEVIHALNDRLREGNILMGSLQKRLALPEPQEAQEPIMATTVPSSTNPSTKSSKKGSKKKQWNLFDWMMGE